MKKILYIFPLRNDKKILEIANLLKQCETWKGVIQKKLSWVRLSIPLAQFLIPGND